MSTFILGFIIAWLWSDSVAHNKIAAECDDLVVSLLVLKHINAMP